MRGRFDRLCRHFDRFGNETDPPCPMGKACRFAHPGDKLWTELIARESRFREAKYESYSRYFDETAPSAPSRKKRDPSPRRVSTTIHQHKPSSPPVVHPDMPPPPSKPRPSSAESMPPPPPPPGPLPPLPPPQNPPALPVTLSTPFARQAPEMTQEQLAAIWQERIDLLSKMVDLRTQSNKIDTEIHQLIQLNQRARASYTPSPIDEAKFDKRLKDLRAKQDELKDQTKKTLEQLQSSKTWPTIPPPEADELVVRVREALRATQDMAHTTSKMEALLSEIQGSIGKDNDAMDVDPPDPSRPPKRRRMSTDPDRQTEPSEAELQEVREKLHNIELRISNFENDINARDEELAEEVNERLEVRFDELLNERMQELSVRDEEILAQMKKVDEEASNAQSAVSEVAGEIADLMTRAEAMEQEIVAVRKENQEFSGLVAAWDQKLEKYAQAREQDHDTIAALHATLNAYMQRPISPPASPRLPMRDDLVQALQAPITDQLREAVKPILEDFRTEIQVMQHKHGHEVYHNISQKIEATARIVNAVSTIIQPPNSQPAS